MAAPALLTDAPTIVSTHALAPLQSEVNSILTAVAAGMRKEEGSTDVRHAATVALTNALEFASTNFGNDAERNYIMQIVCEATIAGKTLLQFCFWLLKR